MANLETLRAQLPVLNRGAFLNTGSCGPLPLPVVQAMQEAALTQLNAGRLIPEYFDAVVRRETETRAAMANLMGCSPDEIALMHNTTEGMNVVTLGVNWQPGDELITTELEHPGALLPAYTVRDRFGVTVKIADLEQQPGEAVATLERLITPRTRLIVVSHVAWSTGALLPVQEIAAMAHRHGVLVLVDGAQSFAALPLNVSELGIDAYAVPGQKWLCGPEGTGALYVRRSVLSQLRITFAGWNTMESLSLRAGYGARNTAQRFEHATMSPSDTAGLLAAVRWFAQEVGLDWASTRVQALARYARERLLAVPGVTVLTPAEHAGLIAFRVAGVVPEKIAQELHGQGIFVRSVAPVAAVRVSTGFYNTEAEIDALLAGLGQIVV